jgi:hypothetical protein
MSFEFTGAFGLPSVQGALETSENVFWWGRFEQEAFIGSLIDGSTRDAGNTGYTDVLRPGLLLGKITSSGKLKEWSPTAVDGTEKVFGVLGYAQKMQRLGSNADRWLGWIYTWGFLKAERLLIPGSTNYGISGNANEHLIRSQFHNRFHFNDQLEGNSFGGIRNVVAKTSDYTVTAADHDTLFTTRGAAGSVNFTLPVLPLEGLRYKFINCAANNMVITSGTSDQLVTFNDLNADSITTGAAGEQIGVGFEVYGDGTGWLVFTNLPQEAVTLTIGT